MRSLCLVSVLALLGGCAVSPAGQADIHRQLAAIASPDARERARGACELQALGTRAAPAIPALVQLLADKTPVAGNVCDRGLARSHPACKGQTTPGREAAATLASIGHAAFESLLAAIGDSPRATRAAAVFGLGGLKGRRPLPSVSAAVREGEAPARNQAAACRCSRMARSPRYAIRASTRPWGC